MNRQDKEQLVASLRERFSASQAAFLVGVQGLTVAQVQSLRKGVRKFGGQVQVAKNTLLERAAEGIAGIQDLRPQFTRQIAVVFASADAPGVARAIFEVKRSCELLTVTAGCLDGKVVDGAMVQYLASLPPRDQLLGQVCGVLNATVAKLLWVLKQASEKGQ